MDKPTVRAPVSSDKKTAPTLHPECRRASVAAHERPSVGAGLVEETLGKDRHDKGIDHLTK